MQDETYILDEPPVDKTLNFPKEHRYQFHRVSNAWRSKYKCHIGKKQIFKQLKMEFRAYPTDALIPAYADLISRTQTSWRDLYLSALELEFTSRNLPYPPDISTLLDSDESETPTPIENETE